MNIDILQPETGYLGMPMIRIGDWQTLEDLMSAGAQVRAEHKRAYVFTAVPAENTALIRQLEAAGYGFSEFRIRSLKQLNAQPGGTRSFYPYQAELIGDEELLAKALELLDATVKDDRFSGDEQIPEGFTRRRCRGNLEKSYSSYPSEFLLGVTNAHDGSLLAFRSGSFLSKTEVLYYQYGTSPALDAGHTTSMLDAFSEEFLYNRGIRLIHAVSTGFNIAELNRLILSSNFRIHSSEVLMRKIV